MKCISLPDYQKIADEILDSVTECFTTKNGGDAKSHIGCHLQSLYNKGFIDGKVHMLNCMESNIEKEKGNR